MPRVRPLQLLLAVLALAAVLRFAALDARGFWLDEIITLLTIRGGLDDVLGRLGEVSGPPLYSVVAWAWAQAFGTGEVAMRSLTAIFGVATVWVAWACALRLGGVRAAVFAGVLAATSPLMVWQAQDARAYALLVLLCAVSLLALLRALEHPSAGRLAAWAATCVLAVVTHYDAAFVAGAEGLVLLVVLGRDRRHRKLVVGALVLAALPAAALVPLALSQAEGTGGGNPGSSSLASRLATLVAQFVGGFQPQPQLAAVGVGALLVGAAVLVAVWRAPAARLRGAAVPLAVGAGALVAAALAALAGVDHLVTRYQSGAWIPLAVALAVALAQVPARRLAGGAIALVALYGVLVVVTTAGNSKFDHEDWRGAARAIEGRPDVVAMWPDGGLGPLDHYLPGMDLERSAELEQQRALGRPPPVAVGVRDLAIVLLPPRYREVGQASRVPQVRAPRELPGGLRLVGRTRGEEFVVLRYRSDRPAEVGTQLVEPLGAPGGGGQPTLLLAARTAVR